MKSRLTQVAISWQGDLRGSGSAELSSGPTPLAVAGAHGGSGAGASPEELLGAAAASCLAATLAAVLGRHEIVARRLTVTTRIEVASDRGLRLVAVHHRARIELGADAGADLLERARAVTMDAEAGSMVSRALAGKARVLFDLEIRA